MTVVPLDRATHERVQALLPWYLTRRLEPQEQALVEQHLAHCTQCRAELAFEQRLQAALAALPAGEPAELGLARLRPRLQPRPRRAAWRRALTTTAVLAGTTAALLLGGPAFRALGPPAAAPADLIVRFRPGITMDEVQRHLPDGARLLRATATDGWLLTVPTPQRAEVLRRLRADPAVLLAEPLDADTPR